jgi:hypothetical protein
MNKFFITTLFFLLIIFIQTNPEINQKSIAELDEVAKSLIGNVNLTVNNEFVFF